MPHRVVTKKQALDYHQFPQAGKISIEVTKPIKTQKDLSLAYTPGVATPCLEIEKNPNDAYKYTTKKNLVAVISNGTAVLGLGNIGALASKPVMEGKGVLFKSFSGLDSFDIEVDEKEKDAIVDLFYNPAIVESLTPGPGEEPSYASKLEDTTVTPPDVEVFLRTRDARIIRLVERLPDREKRIIVERFGLAGEEPKTLKDIGRDMGITRERVRQIQHKTMDKLKKLLTQAQEEEDLFDDRAS